MASIGKIGAQGGISFVATGNPFIAAGVVGIPRLVNFIVAAREKAHERKLEQRKLPSTNQTCPLPGQHRKQYAFKGDAAMKNSILAGFGSCMSVSLWRRFASNRTNRAPTCPQLPWSVFQINRCNSVTEVIYRTRVVHDQAPKRRRLLQPPLNPAPIRHDQCSTSGPFSIGRTAHSFGRRKNERDQNIG